MKSLSKSSQIPLYQQVVEWIRESIYTGDLVEDDRIPSEYQIMDISGSDSGHYCRPVDCYQNRAVYYRNGERR